MKKQSDGTLVEFFYAPEDGDFISLLSNWEPTKNAVFKSTADLEGTNDVVNVKLDGYSAFEVSNGSIVMYYRPADQTTGNPGYPGFLVMTKEQYKAYKVNQNLLNGWFPVDEVEAPLCKTVQVYDYQSGYSFASFNGRLWTTTDGNPFIEGPHLWKHVTEVFL